MQRWWWWWGALMDVHGNTDEKVQRAVTHRSRAREAEEPDVETGASGRRPPLLLLLSRSLLLRRGYPLHGNARARYSSRPHAYVTIPLATSTSSMNERVAKGQGHTPLRSTSEGLAMQWNA